MRGARLSKALLFARRRAIWGAFVAVVAVWGVGMAFAQSSSATYAIPRQSIDGALGAVTALANSVTTTSIVDGSITAADINASQVQRRLGASCAAGSSIRDVAQDGSVTCETDDGGSGTVTSIATGTGLTGGPISGSGTISIANSGVGSAQIADGGIAAVDVANNSLGAAQIAPDAIGTSELAPDAVSTGSVQNAAITSPKIALGAVGLLQIDPAQVQARFSGDCGLGGYLRGVAAGGSVLCADVPGVTTLTQVGDIDGPFASVSLAAEGLPVVAYSDSVAANFKIARCLNLACTASTITTIDDPNNNAVGGLSLAIGSDGRPVISYYDSVLNALKVARCNNSACDSGAVINIVYNPADSVGAPSAIAIGADGWPVIAFRNITDDSLMVAKCSNTSCSAGVTIATVDNPANELATSLSIAVGAD